MKARIALMLAACGAAACSAYAQPFMINLSGATAQSSFFRADAVTNDFIDADDDMETGEQLANASTTTFELLLPDLSNAEFNDWWVLDYRAVGSGNGVRELLAWGRRGVFATMPDGMNENFNGVTLDSGTTSEATYNRVFYISGASVSSPGNSANPGAKPVRQDTTTFAATTSTGANTGIHIDVATADVPFSWFVQTAGSGEPVTQPGGTGYGSNPRTAVNKDGSDALDTSNNPQTNQVTDPSAFGLNTNIFSPDANTVFDFAVGVVPIAAMVNYGVGLEQMKQSELQHLFGTGRTIKGENLMAITRDVGSGTRNAFLNGICLDPSWGVGENIGARNSSSSSDRLGPDYQPTNKGGSSRVEGAVINTRLGIGHNSAERGTASGGDRGWLINGTADLLAIQNDVIGGTEFSRPTLDDVLDNDTNGYIVSGPASLSLVGDPTTNAAEFGGNGTADGVSVFGVENPHAAAWTNNILQSVAAFTTLPGGSATAFSPGEFLAANNLIEAATDNIRDLSVACDITPNPLLNQTLQDFTRNLAGQTFAAPEYASFNSGASGVAPARTTGMMYSDANAGDFYVADDGTQIAYRSALTAANRIAGDFNFDGLRNIDDANALALAYEERTGGDDWNPPAGGLFSFEINGDFQGDGDFDLADLRYWADGLAIDATTGCLDRCAGFVAIDNAWVAAGNSLPLFPTTLATGESYDAGDAVADIAGNLTTRGFAPVGHDGSVDAADIDYVYANFGDWSVLNEAVQIDLSADINGDLVINQDDVCKILDILGTTSGDVNLDGVQDATDEAIVNGNLGLTPAGWADGDLNGDNIVDSADADIAAGSSDPCSAATGCAFADITTTGSCVPGTGDGVIDLSDFSCYLAEWSLSTPFADITTTGNCNAGAGGDGVDLSDFSCYLAEWSGGCDGDPGTPAS
ncbi:MAG: dockerin type I repeat-containing protein [Planctomycetota bacterium]